MMPTRLQRASASSIEWVVRMAPRSFCKFELRGSVNSDGDIYNCKCYKTCLLTLKLASMVSQTKRFDLGSIPVLGSSSRTILGLPSMAMA